MRKMILIDLILIFSKTAVCSCFTYCIETISSTSGMFLFGGLGCEQLAGLEEGFGGWAVRAELVRVF